MILHMPKNPQVPDRPQVESTPLTTDSLSEAMAYLNDSAQSPLWGMHRTYSVQEGTRD